METSRCRREYRRGAESLPEPAAPANPCEYRKASEIQIVRGGCFSQEQIFSSHGSSRDREWLYRDRFRWAISASLTSHNSRPHRPCSEMQYPEALDKRLCKGAGGNPLRAGPGRPFPRGEDTLASPCLLPRTWREPAWSFGRSAPCRQSLPCRCARNFPGPWRAQQFSPEVPDTAPRLGPGRAASALAKHWHRALLSQCA